jgi:DNA-binding NarL/FixJ family response regulator
VPIVLLADGAETAEIARRLTYSESTIKHVLHTLSARGNFRNRPHAVAFALRAGVLQVSGARSRSGSRPGALPCGR